MPAMFVAFLCGMGTVPLPSLLSQLYMQGFIYTFELCNIVFSLGPFSKAISMAGEAVSQDMNNGEHSLKFSNNYVLHTIVAHACMHAKCISRHYVVIIGYSNSLIIMQFLCAFAFQ